MLPATNEVVQSIDETQHKIAINSMDQVPRGRHTSIVFDKDVRTITNFKYPKNRMTPNSNKKKRIIQKK